jgi:hypothetical protein|tara:strand:+ start:120 stop:302 length:183 start_codon:yes stop_codon:yes gene_type:complete
MNKSALQDIQQALNAISSEIERVDDETKWVALAKKMAKLETRTVTQRLAGIATRYENTHT